MPSEERPAQPNLEITRNDAIAWRREHRVDTDKQLTLQCGDTANPDVVMTLENGSERKRTSVEENNTPFLIGNTYKKRKLYQSSDIAPNQDKSDGESSAEQHPKSDEESVGSDGSTDPSARSGSDPSANSEEDLDAKSDGEEPGASAGTNDQSDTAQKRTFKT